MKRRKTLNKYATNTSDPQKMIDELHQKRKDFKHLRDATAFGAMLSVIGPNFDDYRFEKPMEDNNESGLTEIEFPESISLRPMEDNKEED